jgi:nitrite reductase/ring-hydroxylating ferredoxin subunit
MMAGETDRDTLSVPPDGRPLSEQPAWRQDFPIDWPQDHYVERRDFVKFLTLTSLAFTVGQFWIAGQNWLRKRQGLPEMRRIASVGEVAVGATVVFDYPAAHDACILVRLSNAEFVAYSQKCTHLSCAVIPRPDEGLIHCPCHEGFFDLRTGRNVSGPPPRPLPRITLEIRDEVIYATGVETRTL